MKRRTRQERGAKNSAQKHTKSGQASKLGLRSAATTSLRYVAVASLTSLPVVSKTNPAASIVILGLIVLIVIAMVVIALEG